MKSRMKKFLAGFLCFVMVLGLVPMGADAAEPSPLAVLGTTGNIYRSEEQAVLELVNKERATAGENALTISGELQMMAEQRAMELQALFEHIRPDGSDWDTVFELASEDFSKMAWGENIAAGYENADEVMNGWMNSEGHRGNILYTDFTHIGIACFEDVYGYKYWVQIFAGGVTGEELEVQTEDIESAFGVYAVDTDYVAGCSMAFLEETVEIEMGNTSDFDLCMFSSEGYLLGVVLGDTLVEENGEIVFSDGGVSVFEQQFVVESGLGRKPFTENITVTIGDLTATKTINVTCAHDGETDTETKEPTCDAEGYEKEICLDCGEVMSSRNLSMTDHTYGDWSVSKTATCTEKGEETRTCAGCGAMETRETDSLGHVEKEQVVIEATCEEAGSKETVCENCGEVLSTEVIEALGHEWSAWVVTKEATWDEDGEESRTCSRCDEVDTNVIPKLSNDHKHDFAGEETVIAEATCEAEGQKTIACTNENCDAVEMKEIPALGHEESDVWETITEATCEVEGKSVQKCTRCEEVLNTKVIEKIPHNWNAGTITTEPGCVTTGTKTYTCTACDTERTEEIAALGHVEEEKITEATCENAGEKEVVCTRCEKVLSTEEIPALGHEWSEWKVETEATWTEDGLQVKECARCDEKQEQVIPALSKEHECIFNGKEVVVKEPTCTEEGSKNISCSNPNCDKTVSMPIPALGHNTEEKLTEATCSESGLKEQICTVCNNTIEKEVIDALGHEWSEWKVVTEATWNNAGLKQQECTRCDEINEQTIPALSESHEHDFTGEVTIIVEATCEEAGSKEISCSESNCGEKIIEVIPATGHVADEWETVTEATCTEEGKAIQKCEHCGEVVAEKILEVKDHNYGEWQINKVATTTEEGERQRECADCGYVTKEMIDKIKLPEVDDTDKDSEPTIGDSSNNGGIQTGDNNMAGIWLSAMVIAVSVCGAILIRKRRRA